MVIGQEYLHNVFQLTLFPVWAVLVVRVQVFRHVLHLLCVGFGCVLLCLELLCVTVLAL